MRSLSRRSILPLALLALTSCDEGGASHEDSALCGFVPITITISTLPFTLESAGTLADGDCYLARQAYGDRYKIDLQVGLSGAHVDFTVGSDDFNAFMYLRDVGDHEMSADNDGGDGTDAFIGFDLPSGVYYVFATSYPKNKTGAYTFTISATAP